MTAMTVARMTTTMAAAIHHVDDDFARPW